MHGAGIDLSGLFGLSLVFLWLTWTGRLVWAVTAPLRRRDKDLPAKGLLSASDVRFLRSFQIKP
jgi:hypothetical protein